jgi:hypothetical protein
MNKQIILLFTILYLSLLTVSGCATPQHVDSAYIAKPLKNEGVVISKGMTKKEVLNKVGNPTKIYEEEGMEVWFYGGFRYTATKLYFLDDVVVDIIDYEPTKEKLHRIAPVLF